jgi:membrane associated rhomboid family serine protease
MVGASGALSGLAADWVTDDVRRQKTPGARLLRGLGLVALVLALNLAVWALQDGQLAWETHLGGFLAGLLLSLSWRGPAHPQEDPVVGRQ